MTQDAATSLPKFFKDADDFCYIATPALAAQPGMTPWNGSVDVRGFAVAEQPVAAPKREAKPPVRSRSRRSE